MKNCIIFCAGECCEPAFPLSGEELVIAADGGLRHTRRLGITPGLVLGDFDSLDHVPQGAEVYPVEKDETDALLAIQRGLALGCDRFFLYGGLDGPRLDHTIANLQCLLYLAQRGKTGYLIGKHQIIRTLCGESLTLPAGFKGIFSLFSLGNTAGGVTIQGAKYNLTRGELTPGYPLGVSNHFLGQAVTLSLEEGTVLVLWDRENGLPEYPITGGNAYV